MVETRVPDDRGVQLTGARSNDDNYDNSDALPAEPVISRS